MAKYSPKTKEELEKLVSDESVNLGDIDTSAITDMSNLFEGSDREDFSGIEKWDFSNVENMGSMFEGVYCPTASAICERLQKAYLVAVDEDEDICDEVSQYSEYTTRIKATYKLKNLVWEKYGKRGSEYWENLRVIGYMPKITDDDLDNLILDGDLGFEEVDILLQSGLGVAAIIRLDENDIRDKVLGIYPSRIEALNANKEAIITLEEKRNPYQHNNKIICLGYQPPIDLKTFIGKSTNYMQTILHGANWARNRVWWLVEADSNDIVVNIVEKFYSDEPQYGYYFEMIDKGNGKWELTETMANDSGEIGNVVEFSTDKKPNPNNHFVMIESSRMWEDKDWYDDECDDDDDWDDEDDE